MIIRFIRRIIRIPLLFIWTFIVAAWVMPSHFSKSEKAGNRIAKCTRLWASGLRRILGIKLHIINPETGPKQNDGGLVISNHQSYLDVFVHGSLVNLRFAPKAEIQKWFFVGWVVGLSRPIWIKRENAQESAKSLKEFERTIERGLSLIVYPEGTTTDGSYLLPFKSTPFQAAIETQVTLRPMILRYIQPDNETTACWYGDMTLLPHLWDILGQKRIIAEVEWLPPRKPGPNVNRKDLALQLHNEMAIVLGRRIRDNLACTEGE